MTSQFLVKLIFPLDKEIKNFLRGSKVTIKEVVTEDTLIIEIKDEVLEHLQIKRIVYFKEIFSIEQIY